MLYIQALKQIFSADGHFVRQRFRCAGQNFRTLIMSLYSRYERQCSAVFFEYHTDQVVNTRCGIKTDVICRKITYIRRDFSRHLALESTR